jgi:hypothetical protein
MIKLDTILLRCKAIGITLSIKKFKISKEVAFAGYVVKQRAIRPSPQRAIALKEFPRPQNIHKLRSFLGLAQQLAGFIPDLSHASEPLCHLLKKENKWVWSFDLQDAFNAVVQILTCNLVLINFDPSKPTILLTDASRMKGLGFALVHTETVDGKERIRLVTCGSRSLSPAEKSYAVVELEALASSTRSKSAGTTCSACRSSWSGRITDLSSGSGVSKLTRLATQDDRSGARTSPSTTSTSSGRRGRRTTSQTASAAHPTGTHQK